MLSVKFHPNWSSGYWGEDGRTTDAGHRVITITHIEHFVVRWAQTCLRTLARSIFFPALDKIHCDNDHLSYTKWLTVYVVRSQLLWNSICVKKTGNTCVRYLSAMKWLQLLLMTNNPNISGDFSASDNTFPLLLIRFTYCLISSASRMYKNELSILLNLFHIQEVCNDF